MYQEQVKLHKMQMQTWSTDSALPRGKNATNAKGKATLLNSAAAREMLFLTAREMLVLTANINKKQNPRRSFTKQLQTQKVAKQTSQSTTLMRSQTKLTPWKQRLKKPSLPRLKHVSKVYLDEEQSPDVLYATVELELPNGSTKKLKGKVNTGAQMNLMNYSTFREIFGNDAEKILHSSQVKLTGYGVKHFKNHGKFRIDCVRHNDVIG